MRPSNIALRILITFVFSVVSLAYVNYLSVKERGPIPYLKIPQEYLLVILLVLNILFAVYILTDAVDKIFTKIWTYLITFLCTTVGYTVLMSIFIMLSNRNVLTSISGILIIIGMNIAISTIILIIYFRYIKKDKRKVFENHFAFVHYILIYCSTILSGISLLSSEVSDVWNPYIFLLVLAVLNNYVCKAVITKTTWA